MNEPEEPAPKPEPGPEQPEAPGSQLEAAPPAEVKAEAAPLAVLLHGLGRSARAMRGMAHALEAAGIATWALSYPSTGMEIGEVARKLIQKLAAGVQDRPLYAVTHSLGGIIWRHMGHEDLKWKRGVMIAPPNGGSAVANTLGGFSVFQSVFGPAGVALGAKGNWPFPPAPFGIIAGTRKRALINPTSWISSSIFEPGVEHDGTVAVEETKLEGMAAFVTVPATHTTITDDLQVQELTLRFLQTGAF